MADNETQEPYEDVRYTGADEIGVTTADGTRFVTNGDVVSVPTREVEAWPTPPPTDWERVNPAPSIATAPGPATATPQAATPVQPVNTAPGVPAAPVVPPVVAAPTEPTLPAEPTP